MDMDMDLSLGLELGIGRGGRGSPRSGFISGHPQPLLTLSLCGDGGVDRAYDAAAAAAAEEGMSLRLELELAGDSSSPHSAGSPFSTALVKKEVGELGLEAAEVERLSSYRGSDEEDDGGVRKKLRLTKEQSAMLENRFKEHSTINPRQKHALAEQLNLRPRQIEVWFQNRRARTKLKQMEVDCEFLKKCCQKLSDENRRLQKELQQLKALKAAPPPQLYTHLPAAESLTVCPSCGRRSSSDCADDDGGHRGGEAAAGHLLAVPMTPYYICNIQQHVS